MGINNAPGDNEMDGETQARLALVTAPDVETAERIVDTLVEERVVACGNILPGVMSIYRWRGEIERDAEALIMLKTTAGSVPRLLERVPALHPYEVPEVLVLRVAGGHAPYLDWLAGETTIDSETTGD